MFHSDRLQKILKISTFFPSFQNFIINRENLIKIWRAGGKTLNQETPDQIRMIGISDNMTTRNLFFKEADKKREE